MASDYSQTTAFLQSTVTNALQQASNNASRIYSLPAPVNLRNPNFNVSLNRPNIGPPPVFADLFTEGDSTDPTIQYLNSQSDAWVAKYFPQLASNFKNQPEDVLCDIIGGVKPFGVDKTIFEMVWHQQRDRVYRTVEAEKRSLEASFSARGFQLPPGALVDALAQVEQRGTDAILDVSREQAIKDADIKQRMLEMALQLSAQLKTGIMSSLADFYRMWVSLPDKDIERARIKAQAMSSLYSALSSYYNVEIAFEDLKLKAAQASADVSISVDRNALVQQNNSAASVGALGQAVSSFARIAGDASQAGGSLTAQIEAI
ncbi:hypothetical protein [Pseudomonas citronellolis]|uniref:hypothetical protein n=1 Tax=Pseudomonas citronellolis TaxID=53408 RepID=UPI0021BF4B2B|nr:hypothetical protein [Pseudomonas citronellolis]UXJ54871.1 hypothetical protein N5P21_11945 [Pseudomonas citronellolis]